jgi:tetratricopeptide (TPR) repeat protein
MHVYLYSVLAYFYSSKRFTESINLYQLALSVTVKLYGAASEQAGDIYMDIAKTHIKHNNLDDATHHLEQAIKIYADNKSKTAEILAIMSRVLFLKGDRKEALEKIDRAIKISQKLDRSNELFEMYKFKMSYLQDSPESKYVQICIT